MHADLLKLAFDSHAAVWVFIDASHLEGCGFPPEVVGRYMLEAGGVIPLVFDFTNGDVRSGMGIEYHNGYLSTNLSFDALVAVVIPYHSILQVRFEFVATEEDKARFAQIRNEGNAPEDTKPPACTSFPTTPSSLPDRSIASLPTKRGRPVSRSILPGGIVATGNGPAGEAFVRDLENDMRSRAQQIYRFGEELHERYGVVIMHPDDGWVDERHHGPGTIHFAYPSFKLRNPRVGDVVAIGTADKYKLGTLTERYEWAPIGGYFSWKYERCIIVRNANRAVRSYQEQERAR